MKKTLTNLDILNQRYAYQTLSATDEKVIPASQGKPERPVNTPIYDLGTKVSYAIGRTQALLEPTLKEIDKQLIALAERHREAIELFSKAKEAAKEDAVAVESAMAEFKKTVDEINDERSKFLDLPVEVEVHGFKLSDMKTGGTSPSPEIMKILEPLVLEE